MNETNYISAEVEIEASQHGIELSKASALIGILPQIQMERNQLENQYNDIIKLDIENPETSKLARELRLKIKDNRTKGIVIWHKTTKDYYLKAVQFLDAIKRKEEAINTRMEDALEQIEKYVEIKIAEEREKLKHKRIEELKPYKEFVPHLPSSTDWGELSEEEYLKVLKGAKLLFEADQIEKKKAEEIRLEEERLIKLANENRMKLMPHYHFIENFDSISFKTITNEEIDALIDMAIEKKLKFQKEAEESKKRAEEAERKMEAERLKANEERKKIEQKIKKQQEEKQKLEAQLKAFKEAEENAKKEKEEQERRLKNASDKVILDNIAQMLIDIQLKFPEPKGKEAINIVSDTKLYLNKVANHITNQSGNLEL